MRFPDGDDEEELVPMRATVVPIGAEIIFGTLPTDVLRVLATRLSDLSSC